MIPKIDPLAPGSDRRPHTAGWDMQRKQAYIKSRRDKYPCEVIQPWDPMVRPEQIETVLQHAHPFIRIPMAEKKIVVWQFMTEEAADLFEGYFDKRCKDAGVTPEFALQRTLYLKTD